MAKTVRILHLAGSAEWAGGEVYLLQLAHRLNRNRFSLEIVCPYDGPFVQRLHQEGVAVSVVDLTRLASPSAIFRLRDLLVRKEAKIVQSHGARSNFYGRVAGRLAGVPAIISTVHNSLYDYPVGRGRKALYLLMDRLTAPLAHRIVCVADSLAQDLIRRSRLDARQLQVIHNGIDLDRFNPRDVDGLRVRQQLGLPPGPLIGMIGRMTPQKGHIYFLQAFARVRDRFPEARALIVGDGPLREELEGMARELKIEEGCIFTGVRSDIPELLSTLDVFVLSSVSEGLPYAVLEAMAMARPVVATRVSGLPEIIEDGVTGLLVPPRNPQALGAAVIGLLQDRDRAQKMGAAGRRTVEEKFGLDRMVQEIERLYEILMSHSGKERAEP